MSQTEQDAAEQTAQADTTGKSSMPEECWTRLVEAIKRGQCTPFLGPELDTDTVPVKRQIATQWAEGEEYPLTNCRDLARVAQYLAVRADPMAPRFRIKEEFSNDDGATRDGSDAVCEFLAGLPLPLYISTYYDDLMFSALDAHQFRKPKRKICRWKESLEDDEYSDDPPVFDADFTADEGNPVVFHLFGHPSKPQSLVVTERDYLEFLMSLAQNPRMLPAAVNKALTNAYLLFLGFRLFELESLVLLCALQRHLKKNIFSGVKPHVAVQLVDVAEHDRKSVEDYLSKYLGMLDITLCHGDCPAFLKELQARM